MSTIQEIIDQEEWTGQDFKTWYEAMGLKQKECAALLGRGVRQVRNLLNNPDAEVPRTTRLACYYVQIKVATEARKRGEAALQ